MKQSFPVFTGFCRFFRSKTDKERPRQDFWKRNLCGLGIFHFSKVFSKILAYQQTCPGMEMGITKIFQIFVCHLCSCFQKSSKYKKLSYQISRLNCLKKYLNLNFISPKSHKPCTISLNFRLIQAVHLVSLTLIDAIKY